MKKIDREMQKFNINNLFRSMPNEFQEDYQVLEYLCNNQFLYKDRVKLLELISKGRTEINAGTVSVGGLTTSNEIQYRLENCIKFLYDNFIWSVNFSELKNYICTSLTFMFEKAEYENNREYEDCYFGKFSKNSFYINYYDFINIIKSMKIEDIKNLERISKIDKFEIKNEGRIEKCIFSMSKYCIKHFQSGGMDFKLYKLFIVEMKSAIYFSRYITLSEETINQLMECVLLYIPEVELDIGKRYMLSDGIFIKNQLPFSTINIIEKFILKQAEKYDEENYSEKSSNGMFSKDFCSIIKHFYNNYVSEKLSKYVLEIDLSDIKRLNYMYKFSGILSEEAIEIILKYKQIKTIEDVVEGLQNNSIKDILIYEDLIIGYIERTFKEKNENNQKGIKIFGGKDYPIFFAAMFYIGEFKSSKIKKFIGYNNQFDFLVDSENFNYEKFEVRWLMNYRKNLLEMISRKETIKNIIQKKLIEKIKESNNREYMNILINYFL